MWARQETVAMLSHRHGGFARAPQRPADPGAKRHGHTREMAAAQHRPESLGGQPGVAKSSPAALCCGCSRTLARRRVRAQPPQTTGVLCRSESRDKLTFVFLIVSNFVSLDFAAAERTDLTRESLTSSKASPLCPRRSKQGTRRPQGPRVCATVRRL